MSDKHLSKTQPFDIDTAYGALTDAMDDGYALHSIICDENAPCALRDVVLIENTVDALQAINDTPQVSRLPGDLSLISVPVIVIWGSDDEIVPVEEGQRLADTLNTDLLKIEGGSHAPFFDAPVETSRSISSAFSEP